MVATGFDDAPAERLQDETNAAAAAKGLSHFVVRFLVAGLLGLTLWEVWLRFGAPAITGPFPLDGPVNLAQAFVLAVLERSGHSVTDVFGGVFALRDVAVLVHYATAFFIFPVFFLAVFRPVVRFAAPRTPWWLLGLVYGVGLFVFASYGVAHAIVGWPPFFGWMSLLDWSGTAPGSFVGHVLLALGIAFGAEVRNIF